MALSKKGYAVTLLERFARVGGYATAWKRGGVWSEGVLHEIDDMGADSKKLEALKSLGLEGVEFVKVPEFYRGITSETDFVIPSGVESIKKALYERFADEKAGVEYIHKKQQQTLFCDEVVNNASPIWAISAISSKILSLKLKRDWMHGATLSPSSFGVYLILKGKKAPEGRNYTTFVFDKCKSLEDMQKSVYLPFEKRAFSITDYGVIDSALSDEDRRLLVIFVTDNYDDWSSLDAEEYKQKKIAAAQTLIKRASQIYPDIEHDMLSYEAATPMTNERYTKNPKGAIYGYAQTLPQSGRFRNKFAKILPNLHNASAWGAIGGGYSGAIYGGLMVGKKIK